VRVFEIQLPEGVACAVPVVYLLAHVGKHLAGEARLENHITTLHLKVDLSDCELGQYFLGVRPNPDFSPRVWKGGALQAAEKLWFFVF